MIVTRAEILVALGKAASISEADDALLAMIHPLVESTLKVWMQEKLEYQQIVELLPASGVLPGRDILPDRWNKPGSKFVADPLTGPGSNMLQLSHLPVALTGLEVREDLDAYAGQKSGAFGHDTILTGGEDYYLDIDDPVNSLSNSGILYRIGAWPMEQRTVKVTYYGGHTAAQLNGEKAGVVKLAAIEMIAGAFKRLKSSQKNAGPTTSESIGSYSYATSPEFVAMLQGMTSSVPAHLQSALFKIRSFGRYM